MNARLTWGVSSPRVITTALFCNARPRLRREALGIFTIRMPIVQISHSDVILVKTFRLRRSGFWVRGSVAFLLVVWILRINVVATMTAVAASASLGLMGKLSGVLFYFCEE
jgi:hypothetical protein